MVLLSVLFAGEFGVVDRPVAQGFFGVGLILVAVIFAEVLDIFVYNEVRGNFVRVLIDGVLIAEEICVVRKAVDIDNAFFKACQSYLFHHLADILFIALEP